MTERYAGAPVGATNGASVVPSDVENFFDKYS